MEGEFDKISNRHIAKLMAQLEEVDSPVIVKDAVKKEIRFLVEDIKALWKGYGNDTQEANNG